MQCNAMQCSAMQFNALCREKLDRAWILDNLRHCASDPVRLCFAFSLRLNVMFFCLRSIALGESRHGAQLALDYQLNCCVAQFLYLVSVWLQQSCLGRQFTQLSEPRPPPTHASRASSVIKRISCVVASLDRATVYRSPVWLFDSHVRHFDFCAYMSNTSSSTLKRQNAVQNRCKTKSAMQSTEPSSLKTPSLPFSALKEIKPC